MGPRFLFTLVLIFTLLTVSAQPPAKNNTFFASHGNPIITCEYTADPAPLVYKDTVYLYTGHNEAPLYHNGYEMHDWLCISSPDMVNWTEHPVPLTVKAFRWAKGDAWASQVIERNGQFYWDTAVEHASIKGKAIGVAVSDKPTGPFKDAIGAALVTIDMTTATSIGCDDIDPTVFTDTNRQAWLFWGNTKCYCAKLKQNMIELDGPIKTIDLPHYTEAAWLHCRKGWYYLSYAYQFPEKTAFATARNIAGPGQYKGILNEIAGNCNTNHQAVIDFKGRSYFIYHNGSLVPD